MSGQGQRFFARSPGCLLFPGARLKIRAALCLLILTFGCAAKRSAPQRPQTTQAQPAARSEPRFTKEVREVTSKLQIPTGRWTMIICHHSALREGNAAIYDKQHRQRGMENGLAYHFLIGNGVDSGDGQIEIGSRWLRQIKGGHVRSDEINEVAIGICLVGNFETEKPTANQVAALKELLCYLRDDVVGKNVKFTVHSKADPGHTACPGKYFPTEEMRRLFEPASSQQPPSTRRPKH
ncbi:MAG: peptidoglycan recognition family protein [Nibricoccus sp.]